MKKKSLKASVVCFSLALVAGLGLVCTNTVYAEEVCSQTVNVNACCKNERCCPGTCTKLRKQLKNLRWRIIKLEKNCKGTCPGKKELEDELQLVGRELDLLQQNDDNQVKTNDVFNIQLQLLEQELQAIQERVDVLEEEDPTVFIGPQVGLIGLVSNSFLCSEYLGLLAGVRVEKFVSDKVSVLADIEMALKLHETSDVFGFKLRAGMAVYLIKNFFSLEAGFNSLWTDIDYMLRTQYLSLMGDAGLKIQVGPFFASGHVLLGGKLGECKSCMYGGVMTHVGLLF